MSALPTSPPPPSSGRGASTRLQPPPSSMSAPAATSSATTSSDRPGPPLQSTLPSADSQRHIAEARAAVVATMGNLLDSELQSRASILHENAAALDKQEADVLRATEGLRREREKLAREADAAARRVKELGNVQNWAEVLEKEFLVLEETVRLANMDEESDDGRSCNSCSCSDCEGKGVSEAGDDRMEIDDGDGDSGVGQNGTEEKDKGKGKIGETGMLMDADQVPSAWSDASRSLSLMEPDSSTGTGQANGSETASMSTASRAG